MFYFLDQSIQNMFYLFSKTKALVGTPSLIGSPGEGLKDLIGSLDVASWSSSIESCANGLTVQQPSKSCIISLEMSLNVIMPLPLSSCTRSFVVNDPDQNKTRQPVICSISESTVCAVSLITLRLPPCKDTVLRWGYLCWKINQVTLKIIYCNRQKVYL